MTDPTKPTPKVQIEIGVCPRCGGVSEVSHRCECPEATSAPPCKRNHTAVCDAVSARAEKAESSLAAALSRAAAAEASAARMREALECAIDYLNIYSSDGWRGPEWHRRMIDLRAALSAPPVDGTIAFAAAPVGAPAEATSARPSVPPAGVGGSTPPAVDSLRDRIMLVVHAFSDDGRRADVRRIAMDAGKVEAERDTLRARVAELEAKPATKACTCVCPTTCAECDPTVEVECSGCEQSMKVTDSSVVYCEGCMVRDGGWMSRLLHAVDASLGAEYDAGDCNTEALTQRAEKLIRLARSYGPGGQNATPVVPAAPESAASAGRETAALPDPWPTVTEFADSMRRKLDANRHKSGWRNDTMLALLKRLRGEVAELEREIRAQHHGMPTMKGHPTRAERIAGEAADVGNFAMMIADVCARKAHETATVKP